MYKHMFILFYGNNNYQDLRFIKKKILEFKGKNITILIGNNHNLLDYTVISACKYYNILYKMYDITSHNTIGKIIEIYRPHKIFIFDTELSNLSDVYKDIINNSRNIELTIYS